MCGIAGIFYFNDTHKSHAKMEVDKILHKLQHRGSDHVGIETIGALTLGHRRLAIIDLEPEAAQPMWYANNTLVLCFNGEIYNYLEIKKFLIQKNFYFRTSSDSEVLLAAYAYWGRDCLKHINGMFAFALWDDNKKILFCARDQLGIKPFYYIIQPHYFAFASEAYALAHLHQYALDEEALSSYLLSMYVSTQGSVFSKVEKLAPAQQLTINLNGNLDKSFYWQMNASPALITTPDNLQKLETTLVNAVHQQLRSDVPIGGFLSGGIDSGLITAIAAAKVDKYYTYSVGYEGMAVNELPYAKELAKRFGTIHTEVLLTAHDAFNYLNEGLNAMSEPMADPALVATYLLAKQASSDGIKVLLNGTGGDEIFAGYTRYTGQLSLKRRLLSLLPQSAKTALSNFPLNLKLKMRLKSPQLDMLFSTGGSFSLAHSLAPSSDFQQLLVNLANDFKAITGCVSQGLYQLLYFDLKVYLSSQLLPLLDQMTMAHTLEGRVPLLDIDLVHAAFQFKAKEHTQGQQTKTLLKKIALKYLGQEIIHRKKQGFAGSSQWWVEKNRLKFLEGIAELRQLNYFQHLDVDSFYKSTCLSETATNDMFILYCFAKWYEKVKQHGSFG